MTPPSPEAAPTQTPARAKTSWRRKLLFSLIPLAVALALVEVGVRLFEPVETLPQMVFVEPDPDLIWRLKPTPTGPYQTNSLGFRDDELRADPDRRILLLGDSVSWGDGVAREKCYPYLLEKQLTARNVGRSFEVVNTGVPGYSTFQELAVFERLGPRLQPNLVVLQFCLNDVVERYKTVAQFGGDGMFLGIDTRTTVKGAYGWLLRHSRSFALFGGLAQKLARDSEAYDVRKLAEESLRPELETAWQRTLAEIDGIRQLAERLETPLVLVIVPYAFQLDDPQGLDQPQRRLRAYATEHHVTLVDLLPQFAAERQRGLFKDENHFSFSGHELAAQVLADALSAELTKPR